ncbi:MAG: radical SAM protein [Chitinivibrionales bacterium]|nr:radical SAM protein [Chitinivibrionales bacterium]
MVLFGMYRSCYPTRPAMTKPHALLINPWVADFKLYDEWMHPAGLYLLGSLLIHNGWEITLFDCLACGRAGRAKRFNTGDFAGRPLPKPSLFAAVPRRYKRYGCDEETLRTALRAQPVPDAVFLGSGMTYWIDGLVDTFRVVKRQLPHTPVHIGGIAATLTTDAVSRRCPGAHVFAGPLAFTDTALPAGLSSSGWTPDLRDSFALLASPPHGPVLLSLGCPLRCTYCASSVLQPHCIRRDPRQVFDETALLHTRFGVRDFAFHDDALLAQSETSLAPFLEQVLRSGMPLRFHTPNGLHMRYATLEVLRLMHQAGFHTLRFGFESTAPSLGTHTGRKTSREQTAQLMHAARQAGFTGRDIGVYVMGGLPGQTPGQMLDDIRFVGSLGVLVKPVFLSPIPGTPVFDTWAEAYPDLLADPRTHNDTFFVSRLQGWGWETVARMRAEARVVGNRVA